MKRISLITFLVLLAAAGWAQDKLLYTATFPSPYSPATSATLELWGFEGDDVQEKVNYEFKGPSLDEVNTVRVYFGSTIKAKWTLSALASPPTVKSVYQTLTGSAVDSLGTAPLAYTGKVTIEGGASQTLASSTVAQSNEWNLGSPWGAASTGTWWANFEYKPNLDAMFDYDAGLATPKLANPNYQYLPAKRVNLQFLKNNRLRVHLNQAQLDGSTLRAKLTSPGLTTASTRSWQTLNLWVDGVLQAPSALSNGFGFVADGVRTETLSWSYVAGKKYQLQVVDQVGNSQSVWYPKQAYAFEPVGNVVQLVGGLDHTTALKADGSVWAWGYNGSGQLGNGNTASSPTPIQVPGLSGVVALSAGGGHTTALKADGSVWAWGFNNYGQLGNGNTTNSSAPIQVPGLSDVVALSAGRFHTTALKADGSVWAWGFNNYGQLGNGNTTNSSTPVQVAGLSGVVALSAGDEHTTALKADGSVWAWGFNFVGQLGNGTTTNSSTPIQVPGLSGVVALSAGGGHTTALKADGSVWAWGHNRNGQLGNGHTADRHAPAQVTGISGVVALSAGDSHTTALKADGSVWAWGNNGNGQLGDGNTTRSPTPIRVLGLSGVVALSAGRFHTISLKTDGSVWAWGANSAGQLGNGNTTNSSTPVRVLGLAPRPPLSAGGQHTTALKADGSVWAWGNNGSGQLGNGTTNNSSTPIPVPGLSGVVALSTGYYHTTALKADGSVWAWGDNDYGILGNGTTNNSSTPIPVPGLSGVVALSAGLSHTTALKADGSVWAWGYNYSGQLGNGNTNNSSTPIQVPGLSGVVALSAGGQHTTALKADGSVWAWGNNDYGQLGNGTTSSSSNPIRVPGLSGVVALSAGRYHTTALKADGSVWAWGRNDFVQLGNGGTVKRLVPTKVSLPPLQYDNTPPVLKVSPEGWTDQVTITAIDYETDIDESATRYLKDGVWTNGSQVTLTANGSVTFEATDLAGHRAQTTVVVNNIDLTAPSKPTVSASTSAWAPAVTLTATSSDSGSGIDPAAGWEYKLATGGTWQALAQNSVAVAANGTYFFRVRDRAGNLSQESTGFEVSNVDNTPPTFTIVSAPTAVGIAQTWTATGVVFSDPVVVPTGHYWFSTATAPTSPNQFTVSSGTISLSNLGLTAGTKTLYLRATDKAGNTTTLGPYSLTVDLTAPSAPTVSSSTTAWTKSLTLTASTTDPGADATSWEHRIGTTGTWQSGKVATVTANNTYFFRFRDLAGNQSAVSSGFVVSNIDTTAPVLSVAQPGTHIGLAQTWSASGVSMSDNTGVVPTGHYWFDSATPPPSPSSFSVTSGTIQITGLNRSAGTSNLYLRATDVAGNSTVLGPFSVIVDLTAPLAPTVAASPPTAWAQSVVLTASTTDTGLDPASWQYRMGPTGTWQNGSTLTVTANGDYYFRFRDKAGNLSAESAKTTVANVDRTAPTFTVSTPGLFVGIAQTWSASGVTMEDASGGTVTGQYWFDSATPKSFSVASGAIQLSALGLTAGNHQLRLKATDEAGNITTLGPYTVTVDLTAPAAPTVTGSTTLYTKSLTLTATTNDSGLDASTWEYRLGSGSWLSAPGGTATVSANGSYQFRFKDKAGNQGAPSNAFSVSNIDNTPPNFQLVTPESNQTTYIGTAQTWKATTLKWEDNSNQALMGHYWFGTTVPASPSTFTVSGNVLSLSGLNLTVQETKALYLRATDQAGNTTTLGPYTVVVDLTAPTAPAVASSSSVWTKSLVLTASSGDPGLESSSWESRKLPSTTWQAGNPLTVTSNGTYEFRFRDKAGNLSPAASKVVSNIDTTPPTLVVDSPAASTTTYVGLTRTWKATGVTLGDNSGLTPTGQYWFNSATVPASPLPFSVTSGTIQLADIGLEEGPATLYLSTVDTAGNRSTILAFDLVVDLTPPSITGSGPSFTKGPLWQSSSLTVADTNLASASSWIGTGSETTLVLPVSQLSFDVSNLTTDGLYVAHLKAVDRAGNSTTSDFPFTLDRNPPTLAWASGSTGDQGWSSGAVTLEVQPSESPVNLSIQATVTPANAATVSTSVSGSQYQLVVAPSVGWVAPRDVAVSVTVTDRAGNTSTPLTKPIRFDNAPPQIQSLTIQEAGVVIPITDYVTGTNDSFSLNVADDSPLEYRFVLKDASRTEGEALVWSDWSTEATQALTITQTAQSVRYLYVQAKDAAGNLSDVQERVVRVDATTPGQPLITSTTHPRALTVTDAVSGNVALFRHQVSRSGPMGIQAFEWKLLRGSSAPNPSSGTVLSEGQTEEDLGLVNLSDNTAGEYYWLFSRVLAGNGKTGEWASYPFRIDSTAPANLKVTSSTHPVPGVRYKSRQIEFQWQQPLELTGIKTYSYRTTRLENGQPQVSDWFVTDRTQVTVLGSPSTGTVTFELRAEDWSQNVQEASLAVAFDATPPEGFVNFRAIPNPEQRSVGFDWDQRDVFPRDDVSSLSQGLRVGTLLKKFDSTAAKWVEWSRWRYTSDLTTLGFDGLDLDANYLVVVAVEDEAGNRIETPVPFTLGSNAPVLPNYEVEFDENWNGWQAAGSTLYRGSDATILAQRGHLNLQDTPLSLAGEVQRIPLESVPPQPMAWTASPTVLKNPSTEYLWTASGFTGTGLGLVLTPSGLVLDSLTLAHPFIAGQTLNYPTVQVGPAPQYRLTSATRTFATAQNWVTSEGWALGPVTGLALEGNGWRIPSSTTVSPPSGSWSASSTISPWMPLALTLRAGAIGTARSLVDASVTQENFYLRTGNNLIRVAHAVVSGNRLIVTEGYPQVQGLPEGALRVEDLQIDLNGTIWAGPRFRSNLSQSISTDFGVLTAGTNAIAIEANQIVLTEATLGEGVDSVVLEDLVLEQTGLATGFGTIKGSFEGTYSGFTLQASGGNFGQGTRVFPQATLFLNGYGQTSVTLLEVEIRLDTKELVRPVHSTGSVPLNTPYGTGALTASAFTLSSSGLTANLTATLPSSIKNAGASTLPLGVRPLSSTGVVGAAPQGQTYPALTAAGFAFTPTSADLTTSGLRFAQGSLALPSAFTQKPSTFDGWTIKADNTTVAKAQASGSATLTRGSWTVTFPTLEFSASGLEGLPSLVLPPALGASTVTLSSVGIGTRGTLNSDPISTTELVLSLNQKALTVATGALIFQPTRLMITSASLARTSAPALTLQNLEVPYGATSVTSGAVVGAFEKDYHGFTVTASESTINGANRVLTAPKLALGTYAAAAVTLSGLEVSLDDDSLVVNGTATGLNQSLNTPYGTGAVTASAFTLSSSGLTATLTATLPSSIKNAGVSTLPLGVRSLTSTGVVGAAPQGQTYPALTAAGFAFTPTSADLTTSGLRFAQGSLALPSAFTQKPSTFDGWTIKADNTTVAKAQASGSASLTRGSWTVTFPTLEFSASGLEGLPSLVLPPALGASTVTLSSVGIGTTGTLNSDPISTTDLVLSLNQKALTVATGALIFQPTRLMITSASLARTSAPALTLQNLEVPYGATSVTLGSVAGTFEKDYHGFTVTASASTLNGSNRVLTAPKLALGTYAAATVTLSGLEVSLDDDSLMVNGTATGLNQSLNTPYGTGALTASAFTLSSSGLTANLTALLPNGISVGAGNALPLGVRSLNSTGVVGAAPQGQTYPALTYRGYSFTPTAISLNASGLRFDALQSTLPAHFLSQTVTFNGWTIAANGTTTSPGSSSTVVPSRLGTWDLEFPVLRIDGVGLGGEPKVTLPPSLGSADQTLGTTIVNQDGSYSIAPVETSLPIELFGWTAQSTTLAIQGPEYRLSGVTIPLPGIFQSSDLNIGNVVVSQDGALVSTGNGGAFHFRGTNGFRVEGTDAKVSERGLAMGGKIFLPEALGGAAVTFPAGAIVLEPDGAVLADTNSASVSLNFLGWSMTTSGVTVDRKGLTVRGATVTPLGLVPITLPDFTVYSTGELAVGGESTASGSFPLASITVSYSGLRFDDGLHLSAQITFPESWGTQTVMIDDLRVSPQGTISASTSVRDLNFEFDELGLDAHFDELRISREGFRLSGIEFSFASGVMAGKKLAIDAALLDYTGNLDLYGFSFGSFPLWGYQVNLDSLSVGPTGMGFSGGIRLADNLPIPELAGAYLRISSFKVGFDGEVQDLKVSIDQGFTFTVFDAWQVTINGLEIDRHLLKINEAQLQLPAGFQLGTLAVSGMTLNFLTGEITWGTISVANARYTWNGIVFTLKKLEISETNGLIFGGSAAISANTGAPNYTPYPRILQNAIVDVESFQILPSGLPGAVVATLSLPDGPLFDDEDGPLITGGEVAFGNSSGGLVFSVSGKVKLGSQFPTGLNDLELDITRLVFDASTASFHELDVGVVKDFGEVPLFGYATFRPSAIRLTKTGARDFEVGVAGKFRTGSLPGALANRDVEVQQFRIASNGAIQALSATLALSDGSTLYDGITVDQGQVGILYNAVSTPAARFQVQGKVKLGTGFMEGLSGTVLDIRKMEWTGSGSLIQLDVGTAWTGSKPFFGGAAIENGAINLAGTNSNAWTIGTKGLFVFPTTGIPQGLAGLKVPIGTLVFTTAGALKDVDISIAGLDINLFGAAKLSNSSLDFKRHIDDSFRIRIGGTMTLPSNMGAGLGNLPVSLDEFEITTKGQLLAFKGSVGSPTSFELFAGVRASTGAFTFSQEGVAGSGSISIPPTMVEGLPSAILIQKLLVGWNGALKDLEAGVGAFNVTIGGFSTAINSLIVTENGVTIDRAVLTLPPNMGNRKISITNAGFTKNGGFTGVVGIDEINQDIAGFKLKLKGLRFDVGAKTIMIDSSTIKAPEFALGRTVELHNTTISPSGVTFGGAGFELPDFDYGVIKFTAIKLRFSESGNSFKIGGGGAALVPGLGELAAELAFTNISSTYPIGLERAQFTYTLAGAGVQLGTTGIFLKQITGGIHYGKDEQIPQKLQILFVQSSSQFNLGATMTAFGGVLTMSPRFWVDLQGGAFAFHGTASVYSNLATGTMYLGYGNNIFKGGFEFTMAFVTGGIDIWIFPYGNETVVSGEGNVNFIFPRGFIVNWPAEWWHPEVVYPGSDTPFGGAGAEFGQFNRGKGVKGWVDVPIWNRVGIFANQSGIDLNISGYTLVRP